MDFALGSSSRPSAYTRTMPRAAVIIIIITTGSRGAMGTVMETPLDCHVMGCRISNKGDGYHLRGDLALVGKTVRRDEWKEEFESKYRSGC